MNVTKLKQNLFWVVMGGLGVILVAAFVLVVWPAMGKASESAKSLGNHRTNLQQKLEQLPPVPSQADVQSWQNYRRTLRERAEQMIEFYLKADLTLEKWLDDQQQAPDLYAFNSWYDQKRKDMDAALPNPKDAEEPASGYLWEVLNITEIEQKISSPQQRLDLMRAVMKRYWIRKKLESAMAPIKGSIRELTEVVFLEDLFARYLLSSPPKWKKLTGGSMSPYAGVHLEMEYVVSSGYKDPTGQKDAPLAGTITFGISLQMKNSEVPTLISNLLSPSVPPNLLIEIIGLTIEAADQNKFDEEVPIPETEPQEKRDEIIRKKYEAIAAQPVQVRITGRLLDVDSAMLQRKLEDIRKGPPAPQ